MYKFRKVVSRSLLTAIFLLYIVSLVVLRSLPPDTGDDPSLDQGRSEGSPDPGRILGHPAGGRTTTYRNRSDCSASQLAQPLHLLINQPHLCEPSEDIPQGTYLLILVLSHNLNHARRNAIRDTWGRITRDFDNPQPVSILFLLGATGQEKEDRFIQKEASLYRDILQGDFIDGYHNLSTKSVMGLKWSAKYCSDSKYVLKTDDDVFLNITTVLQYLYNKPRTRLLQGHVNTDAFVMRIGQWGVSKKDYPLSKYPPYCSGACYIMSMDVLRALYKSYRVGNDKVFPVEDVFITGLLAQKANIRCMHDDHFPTWTTLITPGTVNRVLMTQLFGVHGVSYEKMYVLWRQADQCLECRGNVSAIEDYLTSEFQYLNEYEDIDEGFTDV